jgi:hypothetical protein
MTTRQPTSNPQTVREALQALPDATPPDDVWHEIERRIGAPRGRNGAWWLATAAAGVLMIFTGLWVVARAPGPTPADNLASLMAQSQQLERVVARHGMAENAEWSASRSALVYRIADLDRELAPLSIDPSRDPVRTERLWRQRVVLMQSLAEIDRARVPHRTLAL